MSRPVYKKVNYFYSRFRRNVHLFRFTIYNASLQAGLITSQNERDENQEAWDEFLAEITLLRERGAELMINKASLHKADRTRIQRERNNKRSVLRSFNQVA
jgi:hypothetical protein